MIPRRWRFGHLVALVELGCGVIGAGWLVGLGIAADAAGTAGRTPFDRSFPFLLAVAVGVGLVGTAARSWRRANREPRHGGATATGIATGTAARPDPVPPTPLSSDARRQVARVVELLAAAGVLAPESPDPAQLGEAVADRGEPVTADGVLSAVGEADWYHAEFDASRYSANLAFHDSHGEQFVGTLHGQGWITAMRSGEAEPLAQDRCTRRPAAPGRVDAVRTGAPDLVGGRPPVRLRGPVAPQP